MSKHRRFPDADGDANAGVFASAIERKGMNLTLLRQQDSNSATANLVVFRLDDCRFGLPLAEVERIIRAVDVTPLPAAPDVVMGIIDLAEGIVPVVNVRGRFRLPQRQLSLANQLVIAQTERRTLALVVDSVDGVLEYSVSAACESRNLPAKLKYVAGVLALADGLIVLHDLESFLSLDEDAELQRALETES